MINHEPTQFSELNQVLRDLVGSSRSILGANFVGAYLVGSFAVGDADLHSDCDFLIVIARRLSPEQERALRTLHRDIPTRPGHWSQHLEGSYAIASELRTLEALGSPWLFIDHGHREMEWSDHCNSLEHRWSLRERGIALLGPPPVTLVDPIDPDRMRAKMRVNIGRFLPDLESWTSLDRVAWTQRYAVTTICRMLYSIETGAIASKRAALLWGSQHLDPQWLELIEAALEGRALGWDPDDRPAAERVQATRAFVEYAQRRATRS